MKYTEKILALLSVIALVAFFSGIFPDDASGRPRKKKKAQTEQKDTVKAPSKYEKLFMKEQKKD